MALGDPGDEIRNGVAGCGRGHRMSPRVARPAGRWISRLFVLLATVALSGAPALVAKQKTPQVKTISGIVTDEAGNAIQGAMLEMKDLQTGKVLDIYSQDGGQYQFSDLRFDHDYDIQATFKDVSSEVRQVSSFDTRARLTMNFVIPKSNK